MTPHPAPRRALTAALALALLLAGVPLAPAAPRVSAAAQPYGILDLGVLQGGWTGPDALGDESHAYGINEAGQVVGGAHSGWGTDYAFRTPPNAPMNARENDGHGLGSLSTSFPNGSGARDINAAAVVVGSSSSPDGERAFRYVGTGPMVSLGSLGGDNSVASAINDAGRVVGRSNLVPGGETTHAFRTGPGAAINPATDDLGTLGGGAGDYSEAAGINAAGDVVGRANWARGTDCRCGHAFLYRGNGPMADLGALPSETASGANGINDKGQVVGWSGAYSSKQAIRTAPYAAIAGGDALGFLAAGNGSEALAINNAGVVVGWSNLAWDGSATHAFIYEGGGPMVDLNTLLPAGTGWVLWTATAVNDQGQIAGTGIYNGQRRAFLLTPPTPPLSPPAPLPLQGRYVALGDSYSSGEGLAPYLKNSMGGDSCHRSSQGYPALLAAEWKLDLGSNLSNFVACSGSRVVAQYDGTPDGKPILGAYYNSYKAEPPQRDTLRRVQPDLVTLTFGGNDLEWAQMIGSCLSATLSPVGPYDPWSDPAECYQQLNGAKGKIDRLAPFLRQLYLDVLSDAGPRAQVRVLLYPPLVPDRGASQADCRIALPLGIVKLGLDDEVTRRFVDAERYFNGTIRAIVADLAANHPSARGRLQFVDTEAAWDDKPLNGVDPYGPDGHTISCGEGDRAFPWINAIRLDRRILVEITNRDWDFIKAKLKQNVKEPSSFHPKAAGQSAMEGALSLNLTGNSTATVAVPPSVGNLATVLTPGPYSVGQRIRIAARNEAIARGKVVVGWIGKGWKAAKTYEPPLLIAGGGLAGQAVVAASAAPPAPLGPWGATIEVVITGPEVVIAPLLADRPGFPDVTPQTTGATEPIAQLAARGIIRGYADGTFGPADPTLRAQMAALIVRAMGWGGEAPANPFSDRDGVDDELWQDVAILADQGVANGYGDGTYGTTDPVLNAQVISFVTRAMVAKGYWEPQPDNPTLYPNIPAGSGHREDLATYAFYAGAVRGADDTGGAFAGWDQPSSRAYFAFALWQALDSYFGAAGAP